MHKNKTLLIPISLKRNMCRSVYFNGEQIGFNHGFHEQLDIRFAA